MRSWRHDWRARIDPDYRHAGETPQINIIEVFRKELHVIGSRRATRLEMATVVNFVARGVFRPVISEVLPLAEAAEAHRRLAARRHFGKFVLTP